MNFLWLNRLFIKVSHIDTYFKKLAHLMKKMSFFEIMSPAQTAHHRRFTLTFCSRLQPNTFCDCVRVQKTIAKNPTTNIPTLNH